MSSKGASPMAGLKSVQLRLLSELALYGGVQIVRHRRHFSSYEGLAQRRLIRATIVSENEIRYNITTSGRCLLAQGINILGQRSAVDAGLINLKRDD
jgi:hypothetical protein